QRLMSICLFFITAPPTTKIYTLSLHDALPISSASVAAFPVGRQRPEHWPSHVWDWMVWAEFSYPFNLAHAPAASVPCGLTPAGRSEEHTSELQSRGHLVCRLLLEKKKVIHTGT